jgi:hypothetical protein
MSRPVKAKAAKETEPAGAEREAAAIQPESGESRERIAQLACSYWESRGRQGGSPEEDWFRAVEQLNNEQEEV